jgi:hypothetical protein
MKKTLFSLSILLAAYAVTAVHAASLDVKAKSAEIDKLVAADLAKLKQQPNPLAPDDVFVRRVYLDVVGRVPTKKEALDFLDSKDADKRSKLIDTLLAGDGYTEAQFNFWADVLRLQSTPVGGGQSAASGYAYAKWLKDALRTNKPYDQMVRELVTATGTTYENGAVGFYIRDYNMALDNMAVTTQVFLGTSIVCAQCHDHPFDKWTQLDYYQMAAHTYGMEGTNGLSNPDFYKAVRDNNPTAKGVKANKKNKPTAKGLVGSGTPADKATATVASKKPDLLGGYKPADITKAMTEILRPLRYNHVLNRDKALKLPHDYRYDNAKPNQAVEPTIPASFAKDGTIAKSGENPAIPYADWMTSKDNPRFTLTVANRLWRKLMGVGLIEPVDEITDSTVPSNPALMTMLEQTMKDLNYDMKAYLRIVLNSKTYQATASTKDVELGEAYHFPGPIVRRMTAEQVWDSMVALYKPGADKPSRMHEIDGESGLRRIEWLDRALATLSTKELIDGAKQIADVQKKLAAEVRQAQIELKEATKNKDEAAIRKAKQTVAQQRKKIDEAAEEIVYTMGWKKFAQLAREGKLKEQVDDPEFATEIAAVLKAKPNGDDLTIDEALAAYNKMQRTRAMQSRKAADDELAHRLKVDTKSEKNQFAAYEQNRDSIAVRAADLKSPAPNGHFLREFGQSDRELVNNATSDATVGQSLMMLNGKYFRTMLNSYTVISRALENAKTPDQVIDTIYLSLMSRHATDDELAILRDVVKDVSSTQQKTEALWAVINTRQFLFVQ